MPYLELSETLSTKDSFFLISCFVFKSLSQAVAVRFWEEIFQEW